MPLRVPAWMPILLAFAPAWTASAPAELPKLPKVDGKEIVAKVNGEPVTLDEFFYQIGTLHAGVEAPQARVRKQDPAALLDRLVNIKLITQEARNIGLDDLPEVASAVDSYRKDALKSVLFRQRLESVTPEPSRVEKLYRDAIHQVRIASVFVKKESDARELEAKVKATGDFAGPAAEWVAAGKAERGPDGQYLKAVDLVPAVQSVVATLAPGAIAPLIQVDKGYTLLRLEEVRDVESPEARRAAEAQALEQKQAEVRTEYAEALRQEYAKVNSAVLDGLDFEAKEPGMDKLLQDVRIVAEIKGGEPVTVKELAEAVRAKYFHGLERAIASKKVNPRVKGVLEDILTKRAVAREAKRLKLEESPAVRGMVREFEEGLLFDAFVRKAVDPSVRVTDEELKKYLAEHASEYTTPEMMRLEGLAYVKSEDAQSALRRLRQGTEVQWIRANTDGQVDPKKVPDLLEFPPGLVALPTLPDGLRSVLAGAGIGDLRLYEAPGGPFYVVRIREVVPPSTQPYEAVRDELAMQVFNAKRESSLAEWSKKLRAASEVEVYATADWLRKVFEPGSGAAR